MMENIEQGTAVTKEEAKLLIKEEKKRKIFETLAKKHVEEMEENPLPSGRSKSGLQIITINLPFKVLSEIDMIVKDQSIAPSRSELIRIFIREGLDHHMQRRLQDAQFLQLLDDEKQKLQERVTNDRL